MPECDKLSTCPFYVKYAKAREIICKGYLAMYCRGPKLADCARRTYKAEHGHPPPDEMTPSGHILASHA
jgi:hypothetical protein